MKFFHLQKSDRRTIIILMWIAAAALAALYVLDTDEPEPQLQPTTALPPHDTLHHQHTTYYQGEPPQPELFPFDPNTADSTQLLRLGLRPWQVRNIYKYRAAGGVYRRPSDFAKLYGLTVKQYRQLEPYISIKDDYRPASVLLADEPQPERGTLRYPVKLQPQERIALNTADTAQLRHVPGIGSYFARKIVEYRQRLGGYYRVQQLLEIEDFPEASLTYFIIPDSTQLRKLNLNRLNLNDLKRHPYINYYQARAIVDFRRLHGRLESLQQLTLTRDFPPEVLDRLAPYVEY